MPKIRSHSGAKKRFSKTATGIWMHRKAGLRHLLIGMSAKRGRHLRKAGRLTKTAGKTLRTYLPYA